MPPATRGGAAVSVQTARLLAIVALLLAGVGCGSHADGDGHRAGAAHATRWTYTALGDSLAVGERARTGAGYVARYREYIQADAGVAVRLNNHGKSGWTSGQLLHALRSDRRFRTNVTRGDVVTWNIGFNDFFKARASYKKRTCGGTDNQDCLRMATATFMSNWDAIVTEVLSLRDADGAVLRTLDLWYPFVSLDRASDSWEDDGGRNDFQVFQSYLAEWSRYIGVSAESHGIPHAKMYLAFNGPDGDEDPNDKGYIAADGLHPNDTGYAVLARLLRDLGYQPRR